MSKLPYAIHYNSNGAAWQLSEQFLNSIPFHQAELLFCCIGTDRSTGDALGPLIGTSLKSSTDFPFPIFGTLEKPIHALNLEAHIQMIQQQYTQPFVIAFDACLSEQAAIGEIIVQAGPLYPGKAVNKQLPPIGDISVKGVVNVGGFMESMVLQNTRLHLTYSMSTVIARSLLLAWQRYLLKEKHACHNESDNDQRRQQIGYANFR